MEIVGVSHPIPTEYANRVYNEGKTVFIGKSYLGKVNKGDKFIIYESYGARAYTGWADIVSIQKMKPSAALRQFKNKLIVTKDEFAEYVKGRDLINVIEFENFEKFNNHVKPTGYYITVAGKYIDKDEFNMISENKG